MAPNRLQSATDPQVRRPGWGSSPSIASQRNARSTTERKTRAGIGKASATRIARKSKDSVTKKWREHLGWPPDFNNETVPPDLFAIEPPAPSWLFDNRAISRGYLDDACDGFVEVHLALPGGRKLDATARICAAPPAMAPDSLFVRSLADDLDQAVHGP